MLLLSLGVSYLFMRLLHPSFAQDFDSDDEIISWSSFIPCNACQAKPIQLFGMSFAQGKEGFFDFGVDDE